MTIIAQLKVTSSSSGWYMIISLWSCRAVPKQSESGEGLEQIFAQYLLDLATNGCHVEKTYKALHWLSSSIFTCLFVCLVVRPSAWWHLHLSPLYDVRDHTNHIFSESLSSGDDNDWDEELQKDKYKDTQTQTKTETKCFKDPMYAIFIKIELKMWYWLSSCDKDPILCFSRAEYFS